MDEASEARVVVVVIDVDDEARACDRGGAFGNAALVRTVDGEEDPILDVGGHVAEDV